ncbi:MAG: DHH family phosphoesterase [Candidatus Thermoplasmatota archaeon]|nr:DHH family phosphoesterase [Candidatus Thermoplasmatota archaeon]
MFQRIKEVASLFSKDISAARIISHYDSDGTAAAGIICNLLLREKVKFQCTIVKDFSSDLIKKLLAEKSSSELAMFLDLGSSKIEEVEKLQAKYRTIIVLDHHFPEKESLVYHINPHLFGINGGDECCASCLAYLLAENRAESNYDLVGLALAGMVGDKQLPLRGINKQVIDKALEKKQLKIEKGLSLTEEEYSIEKFYKLSKTKERYLNSLFLIHALARDVDYEILERKFNRYYIAKYQIYAHELASILDACGRTDNASLGLAICLNKDFIAKGIELKTRYGEELRKEVLSLPTKIKTLGRVQYFRCNNPSLAGVVAGIGISYLLDKGKPVIAFSPSNGKLKISARGSKELIIKGLDLAAALKKSSEAVGGHGGGHAIAAGATIAEHKLNEFLKILAEIIERQLG